MTLPQTPADLPAHVALALTDEERQFRPAVQWRNLSPNVRVLVSSNTQGVWQIKVRAPRKDEKGDPEPVELTYQLGLDPGEDFKDIFLAHGQAAQDTVEQARLWAKISPQEVGFVYDEEYAKIFIDRALRHVPGKTVEDILTEGGFEFRHEVGDENSPCRVYYCNDPKGGMFCAHVRADSFWLTHEKKGASYWSNLLSLHLSQPLQSPAALRPVFLSPEMGAPLAACADMAVYFACHWTPVHARRMRTKGP